MPNALACAVLAAWLDVKLSSEGSFRGNRCVMCAVDGAAGGAVILVPPGCARSLKIYAEEKF